MKLFFSRAFVALCPILLLAVFTAPARATYDAAIVSADARWVVHADFDALRAGELGKELVSALQKAQAGATRGIIGIDIPKLLATVGSLTAYGTNLTADPAALDGTLVAHGTADLRKIAESILLQGTLAEPKAFSEVTDLPFPAYAITDPKAPAEKQMQVFIAFPPEAVVLVSKSKTRLMKAREVLRGSAPSLATAKGSPLGQPAAKTRGAYLFAASTVPTEPIFPEKAPQARILQLAKSGSLVVGERGPDVFAQIELTASSDRNADKLSKILEGLMSMLSLAESSDRQLTEFLNSTKVTRDDDVVALDLAYSSARLVEMIETLRTQTTTPRPARRAPTISIGRIVSEWTAADALPSSDGLVWHTIENAALTNGAHVTLGRALNGGCDGRFDRVEIIPAGGGAPLVFRRDFMRTVRGSLLQFAFPGTDGTYTLKVAYTNDPTGKAKFAVSVHDPRAEKSTK